MNVYWEVTFIVSNENYLLINEFLRALKDLDPGVLKGVHCLDESELFP